MPTLHSNNGRSSLTIALAAASHYAHESGFESRVCLSTRHWDGDHAHPISTDIHGLWLHAGDLKAIESAILRWTGLPMAQQATKPFIGEYDAARLPGQKVSLIFGPREDTIDSNHPVVSLHLQAGAFCAEHHFVTDQSCLHLFAGELRAERMPIKAVDPGA